MKTYALSASIVLLALSIIAGAFMYLSNVALGSVITGGEYKSAVYTSASTGTSSVKSFYGSLGSVVVTDSSSAAGFIRVFDATATSAATTTLTLVAEVDAQASEGTYTFDVGVGNGVFVDVPTTFDGTMVVTYR